eukprot:4381113-Amphidinium_carterae.1
MTEGFQQEYRGIVMEALWPVLWGHPQWHPSDSVAGLVGDESGRPIVADLLRPGENSSHCWSWLFLDVGDIRLGSCHNNVAYCELSWHSHKGHRPSELYIEDMRPALSLSDPRSVVWQMPARFEVALPGSAGLMQEIDGQVLISKQPFGETKWVIAASDEVGYVHIQQSNTSSFLACGAPRMDREDSNETITTKDAALWKP